MDSVIP
jgi:hypothetical protein